MYKGELSAHQHISTSAHQHISTSAHQHISTLANQHIISSYSIHPLWQLPLNSLPDPELRQEVILIHRCSCG